MRERAGRRLVVDRILGDNGKGEEWVRKVERERGKSEEEEGEEGEGRKGGKRVEG